MTNQLGNPCNNININIISPPSVAVKGAKFNVAVTRPPRPMNKRPPPANKIGIWLSFDNKNSFLRARVSVLAEMGFVSESSYLCAVVSIIYVVETVVLLEARPQSVVSFMPMRNSTAAAEADVHYEHSPEEKTANTTTTIAQKINTTTDSSRDRIRILTHHSSSHRKESIIEDLNDQDIIFPDSFEISLEPMTRLSGPPNCAGDSTFCESIETYPYSHLKDVLRRNKARNDLFGLDETSDEIANRIGEPEEMFICGATEKIIYPKVGKTKHNEWKYIINQGDEDGYVQGVRVEMCKRSNRPCDIIGSLPDGYATSCKQKYVYRRMMGISDLGQPVADTFLMPSACCCSYTRDTQYLSDFGRRITKRKR